MPAKSLMAQRGGRRLRSIKKQSTCHASQAARTRCPWPSAAACVSIGMHARSSGSLLPLSVRSLRAPTMSRQLSGMGESLSIQVAKGALLSLRASRARRKCVRVPMWWIRALREGRQGVDQLIGRPGRPEFSKALLHDKLSATAVQRRCRSAVLFEAGSATPCHVRTRPGRPRRACHAAGTLAA